MYAETHPQDDLTVLVDYYAREFSDALEVCRWWYKDMLPADPASARALAFRIDTDGERYAERLDYEQSVELAANWLHVYNEYEAVRAVMGEEGRAREAVSGFEALIRAMAIATPSVGSG